MRDYGSVSPQFWIGKTGKALRGKPEAQLLALYLMTCPHANMIGVFHCPVMYWRMKPAWASKGLPRPLQASLISVSAFMTKTLKPCLSYAWPLTKLART